MAGPPTADRHQPLTTRVVGAAAAFGRATARHLVAAGAPVRRIWRRSLQFRVVAITLVASGTLVGGFGVSGDGVDQDDVVTAFGAFGYGPPASVFRADQVMVRGVRLPYQKFLRNPEG